MCHVCENFEMLYYFAVEISKYTFICNLLSRFHTTFLPSVLPPRPPSDLYPNPNPNTYDNPHPNSYSNLYPNPYLNPYPNPHLNPYPNPYVDPYPKTASYTFVTPFLPHCYTHCYTHCQIVVTHLLHLCYTIVTLIATLLIHTYSVAFCPDTVLYTIFRCCIF